MNFGEHLGVGFLISIIFMFIMHQLLGWFSISLWPMLIYGIIIGIYSLLPDCDHPISKITWLLIGVSIVGLVLGYIIPAMVLLIGVFVATQFAGHRGIIHSIPAGIVFAIPLYFSFGTQGAVLGFVAFYSHLIADGIPFKLS